MQHDVGGAPERGEVPREEHAFAPWELRVDALMWLLTDGRRAGGARMTVDELRRGIESLPAREYRELPYYGKWLLSMIAILAEQGVVDPTALDARAVELANEREHAHP